MHMNKGFFTSNIQVYIILQTATWNGVENGRQKGWPVSNRMKEILLSGAIQKSWIMIFISHYEVLNELFTLFMPAFAREFCVRHFWIGCAAFAAFFTVRGRSSAILSSCQKAFLKDIIRCGLINKGIKNVFPKTHLLMLIRSLRSPE